MRAAWRRHVPGLLVLTIATVAGFFVLTSVPRAIRMDAIKHAESARSGYADLDARAEHLRLQGLGAEPPKELVWTGSTAADVELAMQTEIGKAADAHGVQLSAFGPSPAPTALKSAATGYQLEGVGEWDSLVLFLDSLERVTPSISISELFVRQNASGQADGTGAEVSFNAIIWGFAPDGGTRN